MPNPLRSILTIAIISAWGCFAAVARAGDEPAARESLRSFLFSYGATVTGLQPGQMARVWLPVAPTNADQSAELVARKVPGAAEIANEAKYGNQVLYFQGKADGSGTIPFSLTYRITRREVSGDDSATTSPATHECSLFLQPDAKVPVGGKSMDLLRGRTLPKEQLAIARVLYDVVDDHMVYRKDRPGWGTGDAEWACDSGYGNCTDFHSLFIAMVRGEHIPAKFEIGFLIPEKHGRGSVPGYHCWAMFQPEQRGWIPVDISEANLHPPMRDYYFGHLTADRVLFSTGRDLTLVPKQDGPPLNFFVYPYVEVGGKPWPADKVERRFSYQDIASGT